MNTNSNTICFFKKVSDKLFLDKSDLHMFTLSHNVQNKPINSKDVQINIIT